MAHKVPIATLTNLTTKFREEYKVYNSVETLGAARWLTKPEDKRFASVVFAVPLEAEKWKCQRYGLRIVGTKVNVVNYQAYSAKTRCYKCQSYSYDPEKCIRRVVCKFCVKNHFIQSHRCGTYKSPSPCSHIELKCANCEGKHTINSHECEVWKRLKDNQA